MIANTNEVLKRTRTALQELSDSISDIQMKPFHEFRLSSGQFRSMSSCNSSLKPLEKSDKPLIYVISIEDENAREQLIRCFIDFSISNKTKTKNFDRVNHSRFNKVANPVLYVGSCHSTFNSRLKDHLGVKKGKRTYGMHLSKWDNAMDYTLLVKTYRIISRRGNDVSHALLESIEQTMWDMLQPTFGKRSGLL